MMSIYPASLRVAVVADASRPLIVRLRVTGDIDEASAVTLFRALRYALRDTDRLVEVDLGGVTFFSSAGIDALVAARRTGGDRLTLLNVGRAVRRLLEILDLAAAFPVTAPGIGSRGHHRHRALLPAQRP
jgi:anti-anti-sigma factor